MRAWRVKSLEFVNVNFHMRDVPNMERAVEKLAVELVMLNNCSFPGVKAGPEAIRFLTAIHRFVEPFVVVYWKVIGVSKRWCASMGMRSCVTWSTLLLRPATVTLVMMLVSARTRSR